MFPILNPPPSSLPIPSLWVVWVHQPQASSIVHWTWTGDSFHTWYYTCFNAILPNLPTFSLSHRVLFWIFHINGIKQNAAFGDWLLSLRIMFSKFIHIIACIRTSFKCKKYFMVWIYHILFIYHLKDTWVVTSLQLSPIMLLWTFMYKFWMDTGLHFSWVGT